MHMKGKKKETERDQYFSVEVNDKDEAKIIANCDLGEEGDRTGQEQLVPELGCTRPAPSRQWCWDLPASLAPGPFCMWARGLQLPQASLETSGCPERDVGWE